MVRNNAISFLDDIAKKIPNNIAIVDGEKQISFLDLHKLSRGTGTWLLQNGYTGENIAILLPKGSPAIVSFFGSLYSGNVYVPLDYNDAKERIVKIISKVEAPIVITDEKNASWLKEAGITAVLYDEISKDVINDEKIDNILDRTYDLQPAYIMHTSGSTGEPKGVVVHHRGIIDFADWITSYMGLDEKSVIALQSPFHFDASVFDIYACIDVGAKIVIMPDILAQFPAKVPQFIEENKITCIFWVPGLLANIANSGALKEYKMETLELFTFIGEIMPTKQLNMWINENPNRQYINLYGPTEATVACTAYRIEEKLNDTDVIPIGKASENKRLFVLNEENKQAGCEEIGEICIAGSGVALGYYKEKELTEKVFVQNPLNPNYEDIIYRTGDYGYVNKNGDIVFSGRKDTQVKIHGIRVELGDIENAACCIEGVERACVLLTDEKRVILFLQTKETFQQRQLKQQLKEYLPKYMIPDEICAVDEFPINKNGKIDRKKLLTIVSGN